jgi:hypothetical protein
MTEKTAFSVDQGLWQFIVIILRGLTYKSCLTYLSNMIMIRRMFQEHLLNLRKVSQRFQEDCLKLNLEKCQLFQKEVQYLGHIVSPGGITTESDKLKAIREWLTPKNEHEIKTFWAFAHITNGLFRFCQQCEIANKTDGEPSLPVYSRNRGRPSNTRRHSVPLLFLLTHSQDKGSSLTQMRVIDYYS